MLFSFLPLLVGLSLLPSPSVAAPAGSSHNVYLVHCTARDCFLGLCEDVTAAAYFRDGPIPSGSTGRQRPTALGKLSGSRPMWEGTTRRVRLGSDGTFTVNIGQEAVGADKGSIVGDATLGTGAEPFVCFKDGETTFEISYDLERYRCETAYWCPSIDAGGAAVRMA